MKKNYETKNKNKKRIKKLRKHTCVFKTVSTSQPGK